jgi:hypothetical protein
MKFAKKYSSSEFTRRRIERVICPVARKKSDDPPYSVNSKYKTRSGPVICTYDTIQVISDEKGIDSEAIAVNRPYEYGLPTFLPIE